MIAYDNKTMAGWSSAGSTSYSSAHVVGSGSERFLLVSVTTANWTSGNPTNITVTYGGVAMTLVAKNIQVYNTNNWRTHLFYLPNPASGSNTVAVSTTGGSGLIRFVAVSYSGVDQTSPILAWNTASSPSTGNTMTISLTTSEAGWWAIAGAHVDSGWTGGQNTTTMRETTAASGFADSNGDISAQTGNARMSHAFNRGYGGIAVAFKPYVPPSEPPTVDTLSVDDIAKYTATLNGEITDVGVENADLRGFVYSTTSHSDPGDVAPADTDYEDYTSESGDFSEGVFDDGVTGLSAETTHYVRAWAHNEDGYSYGDEVSFETLPIVYAISGRVTLGGTDIEGAVVRCVRQSDNVAITEQTTDSGGLYAFSDLDNTEVYHLSVEYETESLKYNALSYWDIVPIEVD